MRQMAQSDTTPFFFLSPVRGGKGVVRVVSAAWVFSSAVDLVWLVSTIRNVSTAWRTRRLVSVLDSIHIVS